MAKTTVLATYTKPNNAIEVGKVEFLLVPADYQDFETAIIAAPVVVTLTGSGGLSVSLLPTSGDDADFDDDCLYKVTERIKGCRVRSYYIDVPTQSSVRLGDLTAVIQPDPPDPPESDFFPSNTTFPSNTQYPGS